MISKVGLAIHNKPWLIEPSAALNLLHLWEQMVSGQQLLWKDRQQEEQTRIAEFKKLFANSDIAFAPTDVWSAEEFKGFDGARVAVIPVQGPLMKSNFCGEFGTAALTQMLRMADNTASVESIILLTDSPGGTVDGTESFANAVRNAKKHTTAIVDGYMCSAAYWVGSSASEIFASNKTDVIGSIGTMISFMDRSKAMENAGYVLREFYATRSSDKNRAFTEARNGDGRMLVQEVLDPTNNEFLSAVQSNRNGKINLESEDVLTGKTYLGTKAKNAGLIDAVLPFDKAIQQSLRSAQQKRKIVMETNTPFQRTLVAASAEAFEVVEGGFLLNEEQLRSIENSLQAAETIQTTQEQMVANHNAQIASLTTERDHAVNALATANTTIAEREEEIGRLNARIAQLEEGTPAPNQTRSDADATGNKKKPFHLSQEDPANRIADSLMGAPKEVKE